MCARAAGWIAQALNTWFWENTLFWFVLESSLIHLEELKPTETSFKFPKLINDLRAFAGGNSIPKTKPNKTKTKLALNDIFQGFCRNFQVGVEKFK